MTRPDLGDVAVLTVTKEPHSQRDGPQYVITCWCGARFEGLYGSPRRKWKYCPSCGKRAFFRLRIGDSDLMLSLVAYCRELEKENGLLRGTVGVRVTEADKNAMVLP